MSSTQKNQPTHFLRNVLLGVAVAGLLFVGFVMYVGWSIQKSGGISVQW